MHRKNIKEMLKLRRITLQTTQETLSILSGVSLRTVKQFESGKGNPTLDTLQKIADVLGLELKLEIKTIFTEDEKSNDSI
ncbi:helix-turn-helix domain-containing protein [Aquirufa sp. A-Brett2-15D]